MKRFLLYIILYITGSLQPVCSQRTVTYDDRAGLSHWIASDVLQDKQGFIWISTWNGLNRYDGYGFRHVKPQPGDAHHSATIRQMLLDHDGNIICKTDGGLFKYDIRQNSFGSLHGKQPKMHSGRPTLFTDREGNLWQVERYGVTKTSRPHHPAKVISDTQGVQARAFMRQKDGTWWLATKEDQRIRIYNNDNTLHGYLGSNGSLSTTPQTFGYSAYCIREMRNGSIWIGCKPGALLRLTPSGHGSYQVKRIMAKGLTCDIVYDIAEDNSGRLWLATFGGGVQCMTDPQADNPTVINFNSHDKIRRIMLTGSGSMACATTNGLLTASVNAADVRQTVFKRVLEGMSLMDVVEGKHGNIYIATANHGIYEAAANNLLTEQPQMTARNMLNSSLTSDACMALAVRPDGKLFIVCIDRIICYNPQSGETTTFARQFWDDACHFSEERPLLLNGGTWVFGTEQGAYMATTHNMDSRGFIPPLLFTELHTASSPAMLDVCHRDTIVIDTESRNFTLSFAALDYTDNSGIMYRTRLNADQWSHPTQERSLTFYNLQPGTYTLEVQSTDRYGRWVNNMRRLTIIVIPHWYETLWARLLGWLLLTAAVVAIIYTAQHIRRLHRQQHELLEKYMALIDAREEKEEKEELPASLSENDRWFLNKVKEYIEQNIGNSDANIEDMAAYAASSRSNLNRRLRSLMGITAAQLLINARMERASQLLRPSDGSRPSVSEVAYRCGYSDPHYFSRCFKQRFGVSPTEYK
ncbi:MAG: helix-turn-helix domain-containing protein [Prevotella sp.]|nr:helix-turn-helix domain-containing protein [Prevotella sp.]